LGSSASKLVRGKHSLPVTSREAWKDVAPLSGSQ